MQPADVRAEYVCKQASGSALQIGHTIFESIPFRKLFASSFHAVRQLEHFQEQVQCTAAKLLIVICNTVTIA